VDYWDYLGWVDSFGSLAHTKRQRAYAAEFGEMMVYTPQMIVGGTHSIAGYAPDKVRAAIERARARPAAAELTLQREGKALRVTVRPRGEAAPSRVVLVRYIPRAEVEITRGENAGREIAYHNVVVDWRELGDWAGAAPATFEAAYEGGEAGAVVVQAEGPGEVLAAARVPTR